MQKPSVEEQLIVSDVTPQASDLTPPLRAALVRSAPAIALIATVLLPACPRKQECRLRDMTYSAPIAVDVE